MGGKDPRKSKHQAAMVGIQMRLEVEEMRVTTQHITITDYVPKLQAARKSKLPLPF